MNFRLDMVVSNTLGLTGCRIIEALLSGNHNPHQLLELVDTRVQKTEEECPAAFDGNFQSDHLTVLKVWYQCYRDQQRQLYELNEEIYLMLEKFPKSS